MRNVVLFTCGAVFLTAAAAGAQPARPGQSHWLTRDRLAHPLRADELAEAGKAAEPAAGKIRGVLFGAGDPTKAVEELFSKPDVPRKELGALAKSVRLKPRKVEKGVQPDGRLALVWWDVKAGEARRSTAAKGHAFNPRADRLIAAVAVLDNKALRDGKWVHRDDVEALSLPPEWQKDRASYGLTRFATRGLAFGRALSSPGLLSLGAFTAECSPARASRAAMEDAIAEWAMVKNARKVYVNEKDRVAVLIVYQYARRGDRSPSGYRFYALSASGKLDAQFRAWRGPAGSLGSEWEREDFKDN
jgi:hypothetical protein